MCGLAGSVGLVLPAERVLAALAHRGPDDRGALVRGPVRLLHARLSIVDVAGGAQPMRRGALAIAFNGEIYNHLELRERHALECETQSDTETLLALFDKLGPACLDELDGMFAFALHDAATGTLWLARDRAGEKPLYLWTGRAPEGGRAVAFASELNALRAAVPLEVDEGAVNAFLSSGCTFGSATPYRDVEELAPGGITTIDVATLSRRDAAWFSRERLAASLERAVDETEALELVRDALGASVRRCLLSSDQEVGAFLSGGIDSGLVCALAARETGSLRTFTVAFDGTFDESALARSVADRHGTVHETLRVDFDDLVEHVDEIVGNYGEPVADGSIVPTWYVSRAARERVKVVLTGDGADEQFAGYRRHVPYARLDLFTSGSAAGTGARDASRRLVRRAADWLPAPRDKHGPYNHVHRLAHLLAARGLERYLSATVAPDPDLLARPEPWPAMREAYERLATGPGTGLDKVLAMDFAAMLSGGYLPKVDIGSMAHSLEARAPFLGRDVIAATARLPDGLRIRGGTTKYLLRRLAAEHLPEPVRSAPKRGFEIPLADWIDGRLRDVVGDRLAPDGAWVRGFCRPGAVDALLDGASGHTPQRRAQLLWTLFCTETWHERCRESALRR